MKLRCSITKYQCFNNFKYYLHTNISSSSFASITYVTTKSGCLESTSLHCKLLHSKLTNPVLREPLNSKTNLSSQEFKAEGEWCPDYLLPMNETEDVLQISSPFWILQRKKASKQQHDTFPGVSKLQITTFVFKYFKQKYKLDFFSCTWTVRSSDTGISNIWHCTATWTERKPDLFKAQAVALCSKAN